MMLDTDMASSVPNANFTVKMSRFAILSDEQQQELLENRQSKNTRDQTKSHLKILNEYLNQKKKKKKKLESWMICQMMNSQTFCLGSTQV